MTKKFIVSIGVISLLFSLGIHCLGFTNENHALYLDGKAIKAEVQTIDGTMYLPLRAVCEAMGYNVKWNGGSGVSSVTINKKGKYLLLDLKSDTITDGEHTYYLYNAGNGFVLIENHVYVESGFLSETVQVHIRQNQKTGAVELMSFTENPISIHTMKVHSESDEINIDVQYPQINGLHDETIQNDINKVLRDAAMDCQNEGLQFAYDLAKEKEDGYDQNPNKCVTYFNYRIKYNQNNLLSIVLLNYQYTGGAHGGTDQIAYTFDLNTGKILELGDLMKKDSGYATYINSEIRKAIDERVKADILYEFEDGKFESIRQDPDFYLSNDAVVIYFQEYEYFPYAAGIQEFSIPYTNLNEQLKTEYACLYQIPEFLTSSGTSLMLTIQGRFY
ncbi:MAG: DUF4163 domain-containing protein [Clostridiales bacterium]|nr:DUF4163 domain-containing protein [Clostridiales bacterium]